MYKKLFTPLQIGPVTIKNRLVVLPMDTDMCRQGYATDRYIAYHEERAKGGWGLILTEDYAVMENARRFENTAGLWCDEQIEGHKKLTDTIHKYGSKIFCQIYHCGQNSMRGVKKYAPSAIPNETYPGMPAELTVSQIKEIEQAFADAAGRAKQAGFDGIEIHAAHGYLLTEFLSTFNNKRTDEYGGCFLNRSRILREILVEVRKKVGQDFVVGVRMPVLRGKWDGSGVDDMLQLALMLQDCGVDYLSVTMGDRCPEVAEKLSMYGEHAFMSGYTKEIKEVITIPVMVTNYINDPQMADNLLVWNKADFVGIGQGSLADPYIPKKAMEGKEESIRYCLKCNQGCLKRLEAGQGVSCAINPAVGREYELDYSKVAHPKKVYVAGGGPGGMEAAIMAAMRGHSVTLFEKSDVLGGQFLAAAYPPGKGGLAGFIGWQIQEMKKWKVEIRLSTPFTKEIAEQEKPDAVIVATGGTPSLPPIKGIDGSSVHTAEEALLGKIERGKRVVIAGGGSVGCETASLLAATGCQEVAIVEMLPELMYGVGGVESGDKAILLNILKQYGVKSHVGSKVSEIKEDSVIIEKSGERITLPADQVIIALGYRPCNALVDELNSVCDTVCVIGGAVKTSNVLDAVWDGFDAGMNV